MKIIVKNKVQFFFLILFSVTYTVYPQSSTYKVKYLHKGSDTIKSSIVSYQVRNNHIVIPMLDLEINSEVLDSFINKAEIIDSIRNNNEISYKKGLITEEEYISQNLDQVYIKIDGVLIFYRNKKNIEIKGKSYNIYKLSTSFKDEDFLEYYHLRLVYTKEYGVIFISKFISSENNFTYCTTSNYSLISLINENKILLKEIVKLAEKENCLYD
jgi:hypothetical protein